MGRQLKFPITIFFPMLDGETIEQAEERMIERIDPDGDVEVMSWNDGEVEVIEELIEYTDETPPRKRACINCGLRDLWGAGSRCGMDGHYIGYCDTWDDWCKHWRKDRRAPGEIKVYDAEVD